MSELLSKNAEVISLTTQVRSLEKELNDEAAEINSQLTEAAARLDLSFESMSTDDLHALAEDLNINSYFITQNLVALQLMSFFLIFHL